MSSAQISAEKLAALLGIELEDVYTYARKGIAIKVKKGEYAFPKSVQNIVQYLKKTAESSVQEECDAAFLSDLFELEETKVKWLGGRKHVVNTGRGRYDLIASVKAYVAYLQNRKTYNVCTIQELCDETLIPLRKMQVFRQTGVIKPSGKVGEYLKRESIRGLLGHFSADDDARRKRESEQRRRDLDNDIKEENLRKARDLVMDRSVVEISKQQYVAGIVKRHVAWRPRMKRQFPDIDKEILDYCDEELAMIRDSCKTFVIDESEDQDE